MMELEDLSALFPQIIQQFRYALSNLHMASTLLAPASEREKNERMDQRAALLDQSFYQMMRLVNQLSEANAMAQYRLPVLRNRDLSAVISELSAKVESVAYHRGITFHLERDTGMMPCAIAPDEMEQIFYNLLSNALKFTPSGGSITVTLRRGQNCYLLTVADTGCGIEPEQMEHLFESYAHFDPMSPLPHGMGLGLTLSRYYAMSMGGTLIAESTPGKGSKFTLRLPQRTVPDGMHDVPVDYSGGFNRSLMNLSDALPAKAFRVRESD